MRRLAAPCLALAVGALLAGCQQVQPTFSDIRAKVFEGSCTSASECHRSIDARGGLDLESDPYTELIDVEAEGDDGADIDPPAAPVARIRVIPGDAANSYLIDKLEGMLAPEEGERMPSWNGPNLRRSTVDAIREWIDAGAPND